MNKSHGGKREGAGRKPEYQEPLVAVSLRMTPSQREKLKELGGARWIREQIDKVVK